jgi:hypothetical protein
MAIPERTFALLRPKTFPANIGDIVRNAVMS